MYSVTKVTPRSPVMHDSLTVSLMSLVALTSLPSSAAAKLVAEKPKAAKVSAQKAAMLFLVMLGLSCVFLVGLGVAAKQDGAHFEAWRVASNRSASTQSKYSE